MSLFDGKTFSGWKVPKGDIGQWNTFKITMKGDHLSVELNGKAVVDGPLPGVASRGPIGLQHHGSKDENVLETR